MNQKYADCVEQISQILFQAITEREENLVGTIERLDSNLLSLLRTIGLRVMSMLMAWLVNQVTNQAKIQGWVIHRRPLIEYTVIFGPLKIESPYLWNKKLNKGIRPVAEKLGITHGSHSLGLTRALVDFGSEESFAQASQRFQEHYGFAIEVSKMRREVLKIAQLSEVFVEQRLAKSQAQTNLNPRNQTARLLLELDGCHLRTGVKVPEHKVGLTKIRKLQKSARKIEWRETRVAFARPVEHQKQRTFVAKMGKYSEVIEQLVGAAYDRGLGSDSQIFALADGAKGLKEALENTFPRIQFILDRPHLKQHLYQAVDAMNLKKKLKHSLIDALVCLIDRGKVQQVITRFRNYQGTGVKEIKNLANYLDRFHNCVHYRKFQQLALPIGSGEIESAHRYIPQKRLKIPGATWHPDTINPMLALRVLRANDWWSDFWSESRLRLSA